MVRNKGFTAINLLGLVVSLSACLLILLYVVDELSYDRFHAAADRLYRVTTMELVNGNPGSTYATSVPALGPALQDAVGEVRYATRFIQVRTPTLVEAEQRRFYEDRFFYTDSTIFDVFDLVFLFGSPEQALARPGTVVLTASMAEKYFSSTDAVGKILRIDERHEYEVTAVVEDWPSQSHLHFDFLGTLQTWNVARDGYFDNNWRTRVGYTYLLLREDADPKEVVETMSLVAAPHMEALREQRGSSYTFDLQPLTDIHLYSDLELEAGVNGSITTNIILISNALLILVIAGINFVNLSTARSARRAKEVGVRKTMGAYQSQLVRQFLTESLLQTVAASIIAIPVLYILVLFFNEMAGKSLTFSALFNPIIILGFVSVTLLVGILAGAYPAFVLSAFRPRAALAEASKAGRIRALVRKGLVVMQFAISIFLLIGASVVYNQLRYMKTADLGFEKDRVLVIETHLRRGQEDVDMASMKQEILSQPGVRNVAVGAQLPTRMLVNNFGIRPEGAPEDSAIPITMYDVDDVYAEVLSFDFAAGRNFSDEISGDSAAFVVNQAAVRRFGWTEPLGKRIYEPGGTEEWGRVIGVIDDFHFGSLQKLVEPIALYLGISNPKYILVKVAGTEMAGIVANVQQVWQTMVPGRPFDFFFLDDSYDAQYRSEERLTRVVGAFSLVTVMLACIGLFALTVFVTNQRTKEVGIRKAFGASKWSILMLISSDYIRLVLIAFIVAAPLAYIAMNLWLGGFAYRVGVGVGTMLLAFIAALAISLFTTGYQSLKAARRNPVDSLRYE